MLEIETKFFGKDKRKLQEQLLSEGLSEYYNGKIIAVYLDTPDWQLRNAGRSLRLRHKIDKDVVHKTEKLKRKGHIQELGFHDWADVIRVCEEEEEEIHSQANESSRKTFRGAQESFLASGYVIHQTIEKKRISFQGDRVRIEIDTLLRHNGKKVDFKPYTEIEADSYEQLVLCAEFLGLKKEDARPWSTRKLLRKIVAGEAK